VIVAPVRPVLGKNLARGMSYFPCLARVFGWFGGFVRADLGSVLIDCLFGRIICATRGPGLTGDGSSAVCSDREPLQRI
jgi:hypothetical protein